jgi:hypothetical protein
MEPGVVQVEAFLAQKVAGREVVAELTFHEARLRMVAFTEVKMRQTDDDAPRHYTYQFPWNNEWYEVILEGLRHKYKGTWSKPTNHMARSDELLIGPHLRARVYLDDGKWWDGVRTRYATHLIYEDAAYWDEWRKGEEMKKVQRSAEGL